jgi:glycosyltransferase involved in cell wall biosynthesis
MRAGASRRARWSSAPLTREPHTMASPKLRVLLDLSMACRGYCGIAQDVRLLYKTLSTCQDVEVTGLIYPPQKLAARHRFRSRRASRADRLANQAEFLWALGTNGLDWRQLRPWRDIEHLRILAATFLARRPRFEPLEAEAMQHAIWRTMFAQTLSAADMPLVSGGRFVLANLSDGMVFARGLTRRRPVRLNTRGYDFLIVQGPRTFRTSRHTRQIVRYHDMIPLVAPDTMGNPWVIGWHHQAICQSRDSFFVCNSEPTRDELTAIYPDLEGRSATIPYALSDVYRPQRNPQMACAVIGARRSALSDDDAPRSPVRVGRYIMCVSRLEPRKNFDGLMRAFKIAKSQADVRDRLGDLKLLIVGSGGWKYQPILNMMRGLVRRGELVHLEDVTAEELRVLYTHAEAFVFPSHAEGFGFPPLEAMQCGTPAIVSDIPAHRWVLGDAALYCNPHDATSIAAAIRRLAASSESSALRVELMARAQKRLELYALGRCRDLWVELLHRLKHERSTASGEAAGRAGGCVPCGQAA